MSDSLGGARVALLEARMESELASLVRRHGGKPLCVPAMREVERDCAVDAGRAIDAVGRTPGGAVVVLTTGVGLVRWLATAETLGRGGELRAAWPTATVVCRGPKPVAVLKREGMAVHVRVDPPHTTTELVAALTALGVRERTVVVVHDGGGLRALPESLLAQGAHLVELQPYAWALPEDLQPLRDLVTTLIAGDVRAVAVTTQAQIKNLFDVAQSMGQRDALAEALRTRVVVAAVGPTCAKTLVELGAPPHVVPEPSKMGALVLALATHLTGAASGAAGTA